jgi:YihY family inner membrane protein
VSQSRTAVLNPPAPERHGAAEPPPRKGALGAIDRFQQRHAALAFPVGVIRKFGDDRAGRLAALVAYYAFFSLFPLLLAATTVVAYVVGNESAQQLQDSALSQIPVIGSQIANNVNTLSGSGFALVIGLVLAVWAGMGCMQAAQDGMSAVWNVPRIEQPSFVAKRLRSLGTLLVIGAALVVGTAAMQAITLVPDLPGAARVAGIIVTTAVNIGLFLVVFQVLNPERHPWRQLLPGAIVGGVGYTLLQALGQWYVNRTVKGAADTYGTFAVVIGLLSWLYLLGQLLLVAAEVNVVAARRLWPRSIFPPRMTRADRRAVAAQAEQQRLVEEEQIDVSFGPQARRS